MHFHKISKPNTLFHAGCVLAIGNMEGVHLGHAALLKVTLALADAGGHAASILTFNPHPREYFKPELKPLSIMRPAAKIEALRTHGINDVFFLHFDAQVAEMSASNFIRKFCVDTLKARHIVTGANFRFGKNRDGDAALMADTMRSLGLGYSCVEPVKDEAGDIISSSRIRAFLKEGNVRQASALIGRPYSITGRVVHGDKRGQQLGFPTANIVLKNIFLPKLGVYTVKTYLEGNLFFGVANLGLRPTFGENAPNLEVHLFDFKGNLYGKRLDVQLQDFIRPEQKFDSLEMMIDQLGKDVVKAKQIFAHS